MNIFNEMINYFNEKDIFAEKNANNLWVIYKNDIQTYKEKRIKLYKENAYFYYDLKKFKITKISNDMIWYRRFFDKGRFSLTSNRDKLARFEFEL